MVKTVTARIDKNLVDIFGRLSKEFAESVKKQYNLKELTVPNTIGSQLVAGKYNGKKTFNFTIEKTSLNKGILKLV